MSQNTQPDLYSSLYANHKGQDMVLMGLQIDFRIFHSNSLKEKRSVVKSIIARAQNRYKISAAEIGENDMLNVASIGFGIVSNNRQSAEKILRKVCHKVESNYPIEVIYSDLYEY